MLKSNRQLCIINEFMTFKANFIIQCIWKTKYICNKSVDQGYGTFSFFFMGVLLKVKPLTMTDNSMVLTYHGMVYRNIPSQELGLTLTMEKKKIQCPR